jgi:DNA helicase-2/ATP-dependent DNA helicase PcrA
MNAELSDYLHEERPMYPTHISNNYARFVSDMVKFKMKHSIMDFDDMLMRVLQENRVPPVRYILIDECQDLSTLQLKVVRAWSADRQSDLYMMGDDDQSLYSFLGADARWMKELSDTPGCETIRLQTTYRFGQHIANRANAIIEPVADRVVKSIVSQSSGGTYRDRVSYESMLADISLRAHGTESCMILTVNNHYADSVREELMQRGIPYANTAGGYAPLESPNAQLYAALAAPREYWTPQEIRGLTTLAVPANDFFLSRGNKAQCERLIEQGWKSGEQVSMTDLYNMGFRISIVERLVKGDMTLLRRLSEADKRYYELVMEHYGLNSLTDPPAVSVGTIHSVKGKESDYVYVLTDCLLKSYKGFKKEGSSERRLAYVAITRCRLGCAIVRPEWSRYRLQV